MSQEKIAAYLQRLTGGAVDATTPLRLSSTQRATAAAWMRREGIAFSAGVLQRTAFSLPALLGEGGPQMSAISRAAQTPAMIAPLPGSLRVGIDLEHVANLPDTVDYREHEFYRENFTPAEIAYCLQRADAKTSLCGLWAAKEAILKARGDSIFPKALGAIEIQHDDSGRPTTQGGALSVSHSNGFCVAMFVMSGTG